MIENLGCLCDMRRRRLEEISAEKEELFSLLVVDELNLLCAIGHSLYTKQTSHIFVFVGFIWVWWGLFGFGFFVVGGVFLFCCSFF